MIKNGSRGPASISCCSARERELYLRSASQISKGSLYLHTKGKGNRIWWWIWCGPTEGQRGQGPRLERLRERESTSYVEIEGESKVQSVLGRVPRACLECQVEIRPLLHSESANSILSHTKAASVQWFGISKWPSFLQPSSSLPLLQIAWLSALQEYASKAASSGPLCFWTALLPDFWFSIPSDHYTLSVRPPLPSCLKS